MEEICNFIFFSLCVKLEEKKLCGTSYFLFVYMEDWAVVTECMYAEYIVIKENK